MATVTITITDDDGLDIKAEFDPPANDGLTENTPAQEVAKAVLLALYEAGNWDVAEAQHGPTTI